MILAFGKGVASHPLAEGQCTADTTFLLCSTRDNSERLQQILCRKVNSISKCDFLVKSVV